jgi:DNA-binding winged helix-turn-helix (wHTH) protein/TolB-like protein/Flp pilus assembly protein TadD
MSTNSGHFYEFGPFRVDESERLLLRGEDVVPLTPKAFEMLLVLLESSGRVLTKEELMKRVWPESFVEEANLSHNIYKLREALDAGRNGEKYIETVPRRGYRFVAKVTEGADQGEDLVFEEHTRTHIVVEDDDTSQTVIETAATPLDQSRALPSRSDARRFSITKPGVMVAAGILLVGLAAGFYFWLTRESRPAGNGATLRSIAVLPFKPLVASERDESLEMGMADALITKLSNIREIVVRPTSAVLAYANSGDPLVAGREQNVDLVLDGRVQRSDDRIRVTVQLLRVSDGKPIWADQFDEKSADSIFSVQDSISQRVVRALVPQITGEEQRRLAKRYTDNVEAYNLYLKGQFFWNKFDEDGLKKAIEYFNRAIAIDPNYALAYTGLANAYNVQGAMGIVPPAQTWLKAKAAAEKALELDDTLADSHQAVGGIKLLYEWDWPGAEREIKRAIELDPNNGDPHELYAYSFEASGQFDNALLELSRAQVLAPLSLIVNTDIASALYYQGNYKEAINVYRKTEEIDPHFPPPPLFVPAQSYERMGEHDQAIAECQKGISVFGRDPSILSVMGYVYAVSGKRREAQSIVTELEGRWKQRYFSPIDVALVHAGLGDKDEALAWLAKSYEARDPQLIWIKVEPEFGILHSDPRFAELLRRMNLTP